MGAVESVKAASDIYAPISGEIAEVNSKLGDEPSLINSSPFENGVFDLLCWRKNCKKINNSCQYLGWIAKIKMTNPKELDGLLDEAAYKKHVDSL